LTPLHPVVRFRSRPKLFFAEAALSMIRALLSAVLALAASAVLAQVPPTVFIPIVSSHDYDSATPTSCLLGPLVTGLGSVSTSGSSATLTASRTTSFTSTITADAELILQGPAGGASVVAKVDSVTDGDTLVMRDAITVAAGTAWSFRNVTCGTGAGAGWFGVTNVTPSRSWTLKVNQIALASGSMAVTLRCRPNSQWAGLGTLVYPETGASGSECATGLFTTTADCTINDNDIRFNQCRWLVALTDDAGDLTTNREQVTIAVTGSQQ
jgi:hypothetical protein